VKEMNKKNQLRIHRSPLMSKKKQLTSLSS
jgi:hypothetical protein